MAFDFGAILDQALSAHQQISVAKAERDTAKYNAAASNQQVALHNSEALSGSEAYVSGNAQNPAIAQQGYWDRIPKPLLYGSMGLLGLALVLRSTR